MCAVRPSRRRTSASQWRGATNASASAAVTGEIYRPTVFAQVARATAGRPQRRRRYRRWSTRSPWTTDVRVVEDDLVGAATRGTSCPGRGTPARGRSPARRPARPATTWPPTSPARHDHGAVRRRARWRDARRPRHRRCRTCTAPRGSAACHSSASSRWVTTNTWSPDDRADHPSRRRSRTGGGRSRWHRDVGPSLEVVGRRSRDVERVRGILEGPSRRRRPRTSRRSVPAGRRGGR